MTTKTRRATNLVSLLSDCGAGLTVVALLLFVVVAAPLLRYVNRLPSRNFADDGRSHHQLA